MCEARCEAAEGPGRGATAQRAPAAPLIIAARSTPAPDLATRVDT